MTFVEKHRLGGGRTEHEWLNMSWMGEIFGEVAKLTAEVG
jgi:hypothetical protein